MQSHCVLEVILTDIHNLRGGEKIMPQNSGKLSSVVCQAVIDTSVHKRQILWLCGARLKFYHARGQSNSRMCVGSCIFASLGKLLTQPETSGDPAELCVEIAWFSTAGGLPREVHKPELILRTKLGVLVRCPLALVQRHSWGSRGELLHSQASLARAVDWSSKPHKSSSSCSQTRAGFQSLSNTAAWRCLLQQLWAWALQLHSTWVCWLQVWSCALRWMWPIFGSTGRTAEAGESFFECRGF